MDSNAGTNCAWTACNFCSLPIPGAVGGQPASEPQYCCYGCRFAAAIAAADGDEGQARWALTRLGLSVFFAMNVMVFTLLLWSQESAADDRLSSPWYDLARSACLLFTLPVVFLLGGPLLEDALAEIRRGRASLSLLLCLGVAASLAYSIHSLVAGGGHVYFEVAAVILVAITLGRWLEAVGKLKTTAALRGLARLMPDEVCLLENGHPRRAAVAELRAGSFFRVLPGERIAADGAVVEHSAAVDEQVVTGESWPTLKQPGDRVSSGTLVVDGPLVIQATAPADEGLLAQMISAIARATAARTRAERLAEQISSFFLPGVALIALATLAANAGRGEVEAGLLAALAVLVIACPCALGLATPLALWAAIGRAAQAGVLIRDGDAFQSLAHAQTICFDKTGTLTTGQAEVVACEVALGTAALSLLRIAKTLAENATHPLAVAVVRYVEQADATNDYSPLVGQVRCIPGRGVMGRSEGIDGPVYLGSRSWLESEGQQAAMPVNFQDSAAVLAETFVAWGGVIRGRFLLREDCRPEAKPTIAALKRTGLRCVILTGDRWSRGKAFAEQLAIDCRAELLPDDKLAAIQELQTEGPVIMVGDGVNDAPALAAADLGVALGSGTDISRQTAGVCLLGNDLTRLPWLRALAKQTEQTIRWNLLWTFAYNILGIGLAAAGWLHPILAALAMGVSSLLVVANSLLLAQFEMVTPAQRDFLSPAQQDELATATIPEPAAIGASP